jgi:hypothetical protein
MTSVSQKNKIQRTTEQAIQLAKQVKNNSAIILTSQRKLLEETESLLQAIGRHSPGFSLADKTYEAGRELEWSKKYLSDCGIDFTTLRLEELLRQEDIWLIERQLNRPLVERLQWDQWDYCFVFIAAVGGMIADALFGDPKKGLSKMVSDRETWIGSLFERIHEFHQPNNPMDYQGPHFGGGGHRLRSIGHDLFGFIQGIWQIKNGTFSGRYYDHGKAYRIFSKHNQFGEFYKTVDFGAAVWEYVIHCFCDFFSPMSLPVPGFGYLARMPNRAARKFAADMYDNGYNFRHVLIQSISVVAVEVVIRTYFYLRMRESNLQRSEPADIKQRELLLLSHSLVMAFNCGKVIISPNALLELNLPQILAVAYYFIPWVIFQYRNNDTLNKAFRNIEELKAWSETQYLTTLEQFQNEPGLNSLLAKSPIVTL